MGSKKNGGGGDLVFNFFAVKNYFFLVVQKEWFWRGGPNYFFTNSALWAELV